ncbi:MAG: hypothetical protein Q8K64_00315 [Sediminibacterium sp.]|nr:hypothetical protein [Sediminibacterium sp.]
MQWVLSVQYEKKSIRLLAKQIYCSPEIELIKIAGRNRSVTLQSNRPFYKARGLKHRRINWKLIDGTISNGKLLELIIKNVELHLREME